jgi:hypothetical protein
MVGDGTMHTATFTKETSSEIIDEVLRIANREIRLVE